MSEDLDFKKREENRGSSPADYWPLAALILVSIAAAYAIKVEAQSILAMMHYFMGFFLCSFALLKLFNLGAFVDGFHMYDLLARRFRPYGYIYPFIELGLGLAYFSFWQQQITYTLTIIVMAFGSLGVLFALRRGLDINCPCMGSLLKVPLSTVTLTEDISMALMAAVMLFMTAT